MNKIYVLLILAFFCSCEDELEFEITGSVVENITHNSFKFMCEVRNEKNYSPEEEGVVISEIPNEKNLDDVRYSNIINSKLSIYLSCLKPNTTYYVKAFCIQNERIFFGTEITVKTKAINTFIDERDGNEYSILDYPGQQWMGENLRYDLGNINVSGSLDEGYTNIGLFYTYEVANNVCPSGWHLPSDEEWIKLETFLGMNSDVALEINSLRGNIAPVMFSPEMEFYSPTGIELNNLSGFSIFPYGKKDQNNKEIGFGRLAYYWTSTKYEGEPIIREFDIVEPGIGRMNYAADYCSIRCVKDIE